jgi:hypothetical protein
MELWNGYQPNKDVSMEGEESPLLEAFTKQRLVNTKKALFVL